MMLHRHFEREEAKSANRKPETEAKKAQAPAPEKPERTTRKRKSAIDD